MRLHELSPLSKGQSICVFQKKLNQNHKIGKECHEHCTTFHCIALFHMRSALPNFTTKVACICIPKNHVNCIDFLHLMSKSCGFGMTGPLDESISCFLIRVDPWVLVPITFRGPYVLAIRGLHILACRGLHALAFRGLRVLIFSVLHIHTLREFKVLCP